MNRRAILSEIEKLPTEERSELLDELWSTYEVAELSVAEVSELDRRMAAYDADPSSGVDADELIARLRAELREA